MRVGFFTEVYHPVVNGIVSAIDGLAQGLSALGHEVFCFAPTAPGYDVKEEQVYRIPSLPLPTHSGYRLTVPMVSRSQRRAIVNHLDVVHAHSPFVTGWMSVRYARRLHIPLVYTYHTRLEEYAHYVPFDARTTRRAAARLTRNFANRANVVIVPTPSMRERLNEIGVTSRVEIVPSGIDLAHFAGGTRNPRLRSSLGIGEGERMLLFVSRLAKEKNVDLLLQALALCEPSIRLVIAGEGPQRAFLEQMARELGVDARVRFLGALDRARLPELYASADAFVFASLTETQGLVLAEAMACGLPVIAAENPGSRDILGCSGTLVPANASAFAQAMRAVPPSPDPQLADEARRAAARFGIEEQARRMADIYESVLTRTYVRSMIGT